jgi:T4 RnlA family RNA ligase
MLYEFPTITHIDQVLAAIDGKEEFTMRHNPLGYSVANYTVNFESTFPPVVDENAAILRECRGLVLNTATGEVISRRYHKFFNSGEKPETREENVDLSQPHMLLEKLDGSMITPLWLGNIEDIDPEALFWCTKAGVTDIGDMAGEFVKANPHYARWSVMVMYAGYTPIFEFCSRKNKIVVDHPVDRLVLTAVRHNITGEMKKAELSGIEVVQPHSGEIQDNEEGYVIRFEDGHMIKMKSETYLRLHRALDSMRFEKDVIRLIVDEKLDDLKGVLAPDLAANADAFASQIFTNLFRIADDVYWQTVTAYDNLNGSKKRFALEVAKGNSYSSFMFKMFDLIDENDTQMEVDDYTDACYTMLVDFVRNTTSSQTKVNGIRHLIGDKTWNDYAEMKEE